jgi:DNA-binding NtrC family response regulator
MGRVRKLVEQSAASDVPILITGEVGVGKDRVAREIHRRSARGHKTLLAVNCASLSDDFFESAIFDREGTSFSDRERNTLGEPESIDGGTLFLDDIGQLSPALQDRLLLLLRRGDAFGTGGEERPRVDFRLIAATHRDLTRAMEEGTFSEDLYYRVNLIHIDVPPLRTHREDIPALLQHFMQEIGEHEGWHGELPESVLARFRSYEWPGNVRELENAIRRFIALRDPTYVLEELENQSEGNTRRLTGSPSNGGGQLAPAVTQPDQGQTVDLKEVGRKASDLAERAAILDMLGRTMGNKKETAVRLGISYKALLYKIRDFGIASARPRPSRDASNGSALPTLP